MKPLMSHLMHFINNRPSRMNLLVLGRFLLALLGLITLYSVLFHYIMEYEGRQYSWITGFYWTLTVMSTLGFGDITFESDLGRVFSTIVLLSGTLFLLILLPFTFIEFFYAPWMKAQQAAQAPSELPEKTRGHIILTRFDNVTEALIEKLKQYQYPYVVIVPDLDETLRLHQLGHRVMRGDLDSPATYCHARADQALAVATTGSDQTNANVAFTVREVAEHVPIIATANFAASVDILELAGCNHVLQLGNMTGQALARRVCQGDMSAYIIGEFDALQIVEATVRGTALVGKTLSESRLRETTGVNVLGLWRRGKFTPARADSLITANTVLVMAGSHAQVARYNSLFHSAHASNGPVIIIGGGRVGKAAGRALAEAGVDYRIIEKNRERVPDSEKYIFGDGAELEVLEQASIKTAPTVIITTHDDDMNIYLTIYCRRLRPDLQILARATLDRNIDTLHRAGADSVLSYASLGANAIINLIGRNNILMVAEGLDIFELPIPATLAGKTIAEANIRQHTGCTVIGLHNNDQIDVMPDPHHPLPSVGSIILIGTPEAEAHFLKHYKENVRPK